jgi:pimeloyl-ACP methyl ester carboxylesterase
VPSLIINVRYDASQDVVVATFFWRIPRTKWARFEESSHMPYWEVRERYMQLLTDFLDG